MLAAAPRRVRYAQVISSGFGEVEAGKELQQQLAAAARAGGMRLLDRIASALYATRKVTFHRIAPREVGTVAFVSQSGGLGTDIVRRGMSRGLKFSGWSPSGNCADLGANDMLEFYLADPQTKGSPLYRECAGRPALV